MGDWVSQTLRELVSLESPSGDENRLAVLRDVLVERFAPHVSFAVRTGGHLVGTVGRNDGAPVLVLGHYDTVWPVGRLGPYREDGDLAIGPGVFDMKGGIVALLWALRHLSTDPPWPVRIVLVADEEVGSPSGAEVVRAECDGARAVFALESPLAHGALKVGRRGVGRERLTVTGREAHAGLDAASGVSATEELADQLRALRDALPDSPTRALNVGRIGGGSGANVVAGSAFAELGLRFTTDRDEQSLRDALATLAPVRTGARLEVETLSRRPAWEPSGSLALAAHVQRLAADLGEDVGHAVSGGAGDANLTGALGIPTVDGLGPRGHGAHAPDETVSLSSIVARGRLLAALLTTDLP